MPQFCSGYFSWWSINTADSPITKTIHSPSHQSKNESIYGTVKFSINFEQIVKLYLESYNMFRVRNKRVLYIRKEEHCDITMKCVMLLLSALR